MNQVRPLIYLKNEDVAFLKAHSLGLWAWDMRQWTPDEVYEYTQGGVVIGDDGSEWIVVSSYAQSLLQSADISGKRGELVKALKGRKQ